MVPGRSQCAVAVQCVVLGECGRGNAHPCGAAGLCSDFRGDCIVPQTSSEGSCALHSSHWLSMQQSGPHTALLHLAWRTLGGLHARELDGRGAGDVLHLLRHWGRGRQLSSNGRASSGSSQQGPRQGQEGQLVVVAGLAGGLAVARHASCASLAGAGGGASGCTVGQGSGRHAVCCCFEEERGFDVQARLTVVARRNKRATPR